MAESAPRGIPLKLRARTILVIEPNEMAREFYRSALKPLGCSLIQIGSGAAALAIARASPPDLVVTELMLPDLPCLELLNAFETDERLRPIPIVAVSAIGAQEALPPAAAAELADCLLKPVDPARLRAVVQRMLG